MKIKHVWLTDHSTDHGATLSMLSMESSVVVENEEYKRINITEQLFPDIPTPRRPLRHTVALGLFDNEDLWQIRKAIDVHLSKGR